MGKFRGTETVECVYPIRSWARVPPNAEWPWKQMIDALIVLAVVVALGCGYSQSQRRRASDERSWEAWNNCLAYAERTPDASQAGLGKLVRVRQYARTGTKGLVRWEATGAVTEVWLEGWHLPLGAYLVARGTVGYGPHHDVDEVLYVGPNGLLGWVPGITPDAWRRHERRLR